MRKAGRGIENFKLVALQRREEQEAEALQTKVIGRGRMIGPLVRRFDREAEGLGGGSVGDQSDICDKEDEEKGKSGDREHRMSDEGNEVDDE